MKTYKQFIAEAQKYLTVDQYAKLFPDADLSHYKKLMRDRKRSKSGNEIPDVTQNKTYADWYKAHKDDPEWQERRKQRRKANEKRPGVKEKILNKNKEWKKNNPEKVKQTRRKMYLAHQEEQKAGAARRREKFWANATPEDIKKFRERQRLYDQSRLRKKNEQGNE